MSLRWPIQDTGGPMVVLAPDEGDTVIMPAPGNLTWADGHNFSTLDLTSTLAGKLTGIAEVAGAISGSGKVRQLLENNAKGLTAGGALGDNAAAAAIKSGQKGGKTLNPQTRTLYTSSNIRTFTFEFLLIPRSEQETKTISQIHRALRKASYPKADASTANLILDFPTTWEISFENVKDYPPIMSCFLTDMSTTFNPSATMWRVDGSPVEVALSVSFTETRPIFRKDEE